jgi:TRAP-type uncharacterized transport system substrate-binding protein
MRSWFKGLAVVVALMFGLAAQSAAAQTPPGPPPAAAPTPDPNLGIAHHKPVFGGACKDCPWGAMADVVKQALVPYGYDLQVCYHCFMADAPRIVGDARMPPPWSPNMAGDVLGPNEIPAPPNARVEFGATADQLMVAAYDGTGPYARDGPRHQLRLIANIASPVFLIVAVKRSAGITDLSQLKDHKGLKIVADAEMTSVMYPYYGISDDALKAAGDTFASSLDPKARQDADVIIHWGNLDNAPEYNIWYEASQKEDLVYLQLPDDLLAKMASQLSMERRTIPIGLLKGIDRPIPTVARTGTAVYGRADMPDDFAYLVAKALDEQQDLFEWAPLRFFYNRYRVTSAGDVPLHPGAARYYRERGYLPQ